jgi:hypothetical protein
MKIHSGKEEEWENWQKNNSDPYGSGVIRFAERWANEMEKAMDGEVLTEEVMRSTERIADTEGITGFMYGAAVSTLSDVWEYGEQLRRIHNLATQIGDEGEQANESGGVLNPALLNIELPDE